MIEENFVRLYATDFARLGVRGETLPSDERAVQKRLEEARAHSVLMDQRKGEGHLAALVSRLRDEASRPSIDRMTHKAPSEPPIVARQTFLKAMADALDVGTPAAA